MSKTYRVNECFYSLQGEGIRAGTANVFVRFAGCNMRCKKEPGEKSPGGFDCDTEFESGRSLSLDEIHDWIKKCSPECKWLILTGGEPALQVDQKFCDYFHAHDYMLAIETNGSIELPKVVVGDGIQDRATGKLHNERDMYLLDWITVSPKVAEHAIRQLFASEVKYVRGYGQGIPKTVVRAEHYLISPAFEGNEIDPEALAWCIKLCKENPEWRLSVQQHKHWRVR